MVVLLCTGASRYHKCIDGGTSSENFGSTHVRRGFVHLIKLLTCYQISRSVCRCVRLQCWAEKWAFAILRALHIVVVGQQFFLRLQTFLLDIRCIIMHPPHFLPDPYPSPLKPKTHPHNNQPQISGRTLAPNHQSTPLDL